MASRAGDQECLNELLTLVEGELRRIAHRCMRMERRGHTLQTTALVNEAYLKLWTRHRWTGRTARSSWAWPPGGCGTSWWITRASCAGGSEAAARTYSRWTEGLVFSPAHAITVPMHDPLKTGTLHGILSEVAHMRSITIESIADLL